MEIKRAPRRKAGGFPQCAAPKAQAGRARLSLLIALCALFLALSVSAVSSSSSGPGAVTANEEIRWPDAFSRIFGHRLVPAKSVAATPLSPPAPMPFATCIWTGGGGDGLWVTATNWSGCTGGGAPASTDDVVLDNTSVAGSYTVTLNGAAAKTVRSVQVGYSANANTITLIISGSTTSLLTLNGGGATALHITDGGVLSNQSTSATRGVLLTASTDVFKMSGSGRYIHVTTTSGSAIPERTGSTTSANYNFATTSVFENQSGNAASFDANPTYGSYTLNKSGTNTANKSLTINGDVSVVLGTLNVTDSGTNTFTLGGNVAISSGAVLQGTSTTGTGTLNITGNVTGAGTLTGNAAAGGTTNITVGGNLTSLISFGTGTNSLTFSGGIASVSFTPANGSTVQTVSVSSGKTVALGTNVSVASTKTFTVNGTLNCGAKVVSGAGTFTLAAGGTLGIGEPNGISATFNVGNIQTTTRNYNTGANYVFNGTINQGTGDIPATVNSLTIASTAIVVLGKTISITSDLTISGGSLTMGAFTLNRGSAGGTFTLANGTTISIAGTNPIPANYSTHVIGATSTVEFYGTNQNWGGLNSGQNYGNVLIDPSGTTTLTASNVVTGTLSVTSGTLSLGANTLTLNGAIVTGGAFTGGATSNITFGGSGASTTLPAISGGLNNLTVTRPNGIAIGSPIIISGVAQTAAALTSASNLAINGTLQLNTGGSVSGSPTYGGSSLLKYNTGGTYGRATEWSPNVTSGAGYPNNVQLSGNTTLNLPNGSTGSPFQMAGILTVDAGSALSMGAMTQPLTVLSTVNNSGTITLSTAAGGDLKMQASLTNQVGGAFAFNNRTVFFEGGNTESITDFNGSIAIPYIVINKTGGVVALNGTDLSTLGPAGGNSISFLTATSTFSMNGHTLTLGGTIGSGPAGSGLISGPSANLILNDGGTTGDMGTLIAASSLTLNNLTINRTTATGNVTLGSTVTVGGTLTLTAGKITSTSSNLLTITNTAANAISGGSASSYINGPLARTLPLSLVTGSTYSFPVGKAGFNPFELVNPTTTSGGTVTIQAEEFDGSSGGTAGTGLSALNTNRYWQGSITANSGNFTNTTVRLTDASVAAGNLIGKSSTQGGAYDSIGGTVSGSTITSSAITSFSFFNIGTIPPPTITVVGGPLTFANTAVGATSAEQTYTVAGSNLTNDISVTAPSTDFQVSKTTGSGFSSSVTFAQSGGTVATQAVFVHFTPQSTGAKSGNVTNASTNATTQNVAVSGTGIAAALSGAVNVGTGQTYPTLTGSGGLFAAINTSGLSANVTANITSDLSEDGTNALNQWTEQGAGNYTLTIQPGSGTTRTISGSVAAGMIRLNGADRVTVDGRFGGSGRFLTFRNTNTGGSTITLINDASNNTIRSSVIEGVETATTSGVVFFSTGPTTGNDNNTVTDNQIRDRSDAAGVPADLIYSGGFSSSITNTGNTISNNELFNFTRRGIFIDAVNSGNESWTISGNTIYQTASRTTALIGIGFTSSGTNIISQNVIHDLNNSGAGLLVRGMSLSPAGVSTTVSGNRIYALESTTDGNAVAGIASTATGSAVVTVVNNQITIIPATTHDLPISGIGDQGASGTTFNTYFNSVLIGGTASGTNFTEACQRTSNIVTASAHTARDNICFNNRTGGSGSHVAATNETTNGSFSSDYNVFVGTGATAANFFFTTSAVSFSTWQSTTGGDAHSQASNPGGAFTTAMFVDPATGNLHITNPLANGAPMSNTGTPVSGITTDYDGDTRNASTPDIGSDEFANPNVTVTTSGSLPPGAYGNITVSSGAVITLTGNVTLNGSLSVPSGATVNLGGFILTGPGAFTLNPGATLVIGDPNGITSGNTASGSIQVTGGRSYSSGASYTYTGSGNQAVGNGLPLTVANLTISNSGGPGNNTVTGNSGQTVTGTLEIVSGNYSSHSDYDNVLIDPLGELSLTADITVSGNWTNNGTFTPNGFGVTFNGSGNTQTITTGGTGPGKPFAGFTVSKSSGTATLAGDLSATSLHVAGGTFDQGATFSVSTGPVTVDANGIWRNLGTGDLTLSGGVANAGTINFDANGPPCVSGGDDIAITSTTQQAWTGAGTFSMTDVSVQNQGGTALITVHSGTNTSGNGLNWIFVPTCTGNVYTWAGSVLGADWQVPASWSPLRATPDPNDILIFDGAVTSQPIVNNVPTQTIAALRLKNPPFVTLNAQTGLGTRTLTISGATGNDLAVPAGAQLILNGSTGLQISLTSGSTGTVVGLINFVGGPHQLLATGGSTVTFAGSDALNPAFFATAANYDPNTNPFGTGTGGNGSNNSITFANFSIYAHNAGGSPFGSVGNGPVCVFQTGSEADILNGTNFQASGRTYANLSIGRVDPSGVAVAAAPLSGSGDFEFDNLSLNSPASGGGSSLSYTGTGGSAIKIHGNITSNGGSGSAQDVILAGGTAGILINRTTPGTITFGHDANNTKGIEFESNASVAGGTTLALARVLLMGISQPNANVLSVDINGALNGDVNGYVIGKLLKNFNSTVHAQTFQVGNIVGGYGPIDVTNATGTGSLTINGRDGKHPSIPGTSALKRYWTIGNSGLTQADLKFQYKIGDVVGTEANYKIFKYNGSFTQFNPSSLDTANHFATLNGVNSFSDWTLAEPAALQPGTIQFSAANYNDTELNSGTHPVTITVTRAGGSAGPASVHYATSNGTATLADNDYDAASGDFNWIDGDATDRTFTVTVHGDTNVELNETVNLTLSLATGATLGAPNPATLTIVNDDIACTPPSTVYVDDSWVGTPPGTDPDMGGPAMNFGCDSFATIQDGINGVTSGGTVIVRAGTYPEAILINKPVTLQGAQVGQDANTRFAAFTGGPANPKANPAVESIITAAATAPASGANDTLHVMASNVTIDGFVVDGNNPSLTPTGAVPIGGINTDARTGIQTSDAAGNGFAANNVLIQNNVVQNFAGDNTNNLGGGITLVNPDQLSPATNGSVITGNVVRNFGAYGILLSSNAYGNVTSNTVDTPAYPTANAGIWVYNFPNPGGGPNTININSNTVTVGQDDFGGIWINLVYAPAATININSNTVNAAAGVLPLDDFTYGIYLSSVQGGSTATLTNNIVGASGGTFDRGIALWNLPTTVATTVTGGTVGHSVKGVSLHENDPNFGLSNANSAVNLSGTSITGPGSGTTVGIFVDAAGAITGAVAMQISGNTSISGCSTGVSVLGANASANIHDNSSSIHDNGVGINVAAGSATMISNNLYANGTGLRFTGGASATAHFNRIISTTTAIDNANNLTPSLENNWWGCNAGPGNAGCGAVTGTGANFDPWIVLGVSATPGSIPAFGNSTITADMTKNSNGATPVGTLPDMPVAWSATQGTMAPPSGTITAGQATSQFTSSSSSSGTGCAMVDNQLTCANVTVTPPTLTVNKVVIGDSFGRFNLQINTITYATNVGDGGSTGAQVATVGANTFGETGGTSPATNLADYTTVITGTGCTDHGDGTGDITLAAGESKVCTITNTKKPKLTVIKKVIGDTVGRFNLQIGVTTYATNVGDNGSTDAQYGTVGANNFGETGGTIPATNLADYTTVITGIGCSDNGGGMGSITLANGDDKICTITNTKKPKLTVTKVVVPSSDPGRFDLQINSFTYATNVGDAGSTGAQFGTIGANNFGETGGTTPATSLADYTTVITGIGCTDNGGGTGTISLAAGDDKVCTITNTRNAPPTSLVVTKTADTDDHDCSLADCSLREAIEAANSNPDTNTITFAIPLSDTGCSGGVLPCTITLGVGGGSGELSISNNVNINGPGASSLIVSGNNASRVFNLTGNGTFSFSGLTISNGRFPGGGGGGAGINNSFGTLNISNSTLSGNTVNGVGGGILNSGTLNVSNSTFTGNQSDNAGAGIFADAGVVTIVNSTFSGNSAAGGNGGGIFVYTSAAANITNCTFAGNSAEFGGGIYNTNTGVVNLRNSIIALNTTTVGSPDINNAVTSQGHNLLGKSNGSSGLMDGVNGDKVGTVAMPLDPQIGFLQDNGGTTFTRALLIGSPAIEAGDDCVLTGCSGASPTVTTDQRGITRPQGSHVDIGAFELQYFVVNTTSDHTPDVAGCEALSLGHDCTLREAINAANATSGSVITFAIPSAAGPNHDSGCDLSGVCTISPSIALPQINVPVFIDGYTQTGAAVNTAALNDPAGDNAVLKIVLDGTTPDVANGLDLEAGTDGSTIRGLVINHWGNAGIYLNDSFSNTISGNFIGTDAAGSAAAGNPNAFGVYLDSTDNEAALNTVGGETPDMRNIISGNGTGVYLNSSTVHDTFIEGNYIGTAKDGATSLGSLIGVSVNGSNSNTIGCEVLDGDNVISGNSDSGILINNGASGNFVTGNFIGTDKTGMLNLANGGSGVKLDGANNNHIGGTGSTEGNVISGNGGEGVEINNFASNNTVQGNLIGLGVDGTTAIGNSNNGIEIYNGTSGNRVGNDSPPPKPPPPFQRNRPAGTVQDNASNRSAGRAAVSSLKTNQSAGNRVAPFGPPPPAVGNTTGANTIAYNGQDGVRVTNPGDVSNLISQNSIYGNNKLGINLVGGTENASGVTANDANDGDNGPNNLQNFPESMTAVASTQTISGTLDSSGSEPYTIEFFNNGPLGCDSSGNGEGKTFIGSVQTNGGAFTASSLSGSFASGDVITATATDTNGNTSEFSACITATSSSATADLGITKTAPPFVTEGNNITYTITVHNFGPDTATDVSVSDTLPANATLVSVSSGCSGTGPVICTAATLANNADAFFTVVVSPTPAALNNDVVNNATVTANETDPNPGPTSNSASATTHVNAATCTTPPSGMLAWYPGDGNADDVVGGHNGTLNGGATFAPGKVDQAFSLNGTSAYVSVPDTPDMRPANVSVDGWFKLNSAPTGTFVQLVSKTVGTQQLDSYGVYLENGVLKGAVCNTTDGCVGVTSGITPAVGEWHHYALVFDDAADTLKLYVDGALTATQPATISIEYDTHPLLIGADFDLEVITFFFPGLLDETEIFNRALDATEVGNIYDASFAGKCRTTCATPPAGMVSWWPAENNAHDIQGTNNGTLEGNATFAPGKVGTAFDLNGTSGTDVSFPANNIPIGSSPRTVDLWVKVRDAAPDHEIFFYGEPDTRKSFGIDVDGTDGAGNVRLQVFTFGDDLNAISTGVPLNQWMHIAVTYDGNLALNVYVNGQPKGTLTLGAPLNTTTSNVLLGHFIATNYFNGLVDEVEVFNTVLSPVDISNIYHAGNGGKCHTSTIQFDSATYSVNEGNVNKTITVTRTGAHDTPATVHYATSDGPNTLAGRDYTNTFGDLSFAIGETSKSFDVPIIQDNSFSGNHTVNLTLTAETGAGAGTPQTAVLTIVDNDDTAPTLSITSAVMHPEGNSSTTDFVFTVTKTGATDLTTTVNYATAPGITNPATAGALNSCGTAGVDYESQSGMLSFAPGEMTKDIIIKVCGDTTVEPDETFFVNLSSPGNATLSNTQGVGTIQNDDADVSVAVSPAAVLEDGATNLVYTFTRTGATANALTVNFSVGGTATFNTDYLETGADTFSSSAGTVTFGAGNSTTTVTVDPTADLTFEPDETVVLTVTSGTGYNAAAPSSATGTILNDECTPPPLGMVSWYQAQNNANDAGGPNNGTLQGGATFAPGKVGQAFSFDGTTNGQGVFVGNPVSLQLQDFTIDAWIKRSNLGIAGNGPLNEGEIVAYGHNGYAFGVAADGRLFLSKVDVDGAVSVSPLITDTNFHHVAVTKSGTSVVFFIDGVAGAPINYTSTFAFTKNVSIGARLDVSAPTSTPLTATFAGLIDEVEIFNRALTQPEIQNLSDASGAGKCHTSTIQFAQANTDTVETDSGSHTVNIVVARNGDHAGAVDVTYTVTDGTAQIADGDYSISPASGTLSWADGDSSPKNIVVTVFGDTKAEADETVNLTLSNVVGVGASLGTPNPATLTLLNDDAGPTFTISNRTANEGSPSGTTSFIFTVTKTGSTDLTSTVNFATADDIGGANPATSGAACTTGVDYISQAGMLSFSAGDTSKPITILVCKDSTYEPNETFLVNLSSPTNATLGSPNQGVGTITNDDAPAGGFVVNSTADTNDGSCDNPLGTGTGNKDCTLREAINAANSSGSPVGISFAIPVTDPRHFYYKDDGSGSPNGTVTLANVATTTAANDAALPADKDPDWPHGWWSILPTSALPIVTQTVVIDGYTQPVATVNTLTASDNAVLRIELDGASAGAGVTGLTIAGAGGSILRGFVINRFSSHGVSLQSGVGSTVTGDFFGTDVSGTLGLSNAGSGVSCPSNTMTIGGSSPGLVNLISGNGADGILLSNSNSNLILGNFIGTKADGTSALGNGGSGINLTAGSPFNTIGGINAGEGNTIAFNTRDGVRLADSGVGNTIRGNSIFSNGILANDLGIDLGGDGITGNDNKDPDTGPNNLQNFPIITSALVTGSTRTITGTLNSTVGQTFTIDFYQSPSCDTSGNGEGKTYLGSIDTVATDANGDVLFTFHPLVLTIGQVVTATATSDLGVNTSEFSACFAIADGTAGAGDIQFTSPTYSVAENVAGGMAAISLTRVGGTNGSISATFTTSDGTAHQPGDYTAVNQVVTFGEGVSSMTVNVPIIDDTNPEANETVNLSLGSTSINAAREDGPSGPVVNPHAAVLTINDNDPCPTTFTVNDNGDASDANQGDGVCATGGGQCTLRAAIEEANALTSCGTIDINFSGVVSPINLGAVLPSINHNVNINGPGATVMTVQRSSGSNFRVFAISSGRTVTISGLTIANGHAVSGSFLSDVGGGIFNDHGVLTVANCVLSGNTADNSGGGIFNNGYLSGSSTTIVNGCTFINNNATFGGGLYNYGDTGTATISILNSTLTNNSATVAVGSAGGAIDNFGSGATGNATLTIVNSTISGNNSNSDGGAIYNTNNASAATATTSLTNVTITNNRADNDTNGSGAGGAIRAVSGTVALRNTIVAGNFKGGGPSVARDDVNGALAGASTSNLIGDGTGMSGISNGSNGNQVGSAGAPIDPLLGALMNNGGTTFTHGLLYNSPAVDAGNDCVNTVTHCSDATIPQLTLDQRGMSRQSDGDLVAGAHVDIGAYERQATESRPVPFGSNVHVDLNDVRLAFPTVSGARPDDGAANGVQPNTTARSVSITVIPVPIDAPPTSFAAFDVTPSSTFYAPPVDVCFYLPSITPKATFDKLKVLHRESGVLTDHGTYVNFASKIACAEVTSFSDFVIGYSAFPSVTNGTIDGKITDSNGAPLAGTTINLSGTQNRETITDAQGNYNFDSVEANGFYTVTPSRANYTFNPANRSFSALGVHTEASFTASANGDHANAIDTIEFFVRQQYLDFLGREPDPPGFDGWVNTLRNCAPGDASCDRIHVSESFFRSAEFQERGYFVYRFYSSAFGRKPVLGEFTPDLARVSGFLTNDQLETAKTALANDFITRPAFAAQYGSLSNSAYVDALINTAAVNLANRQGLVDGLNAGTVTRAQVLRQIAESGEVYRKYYNQAFVVMEYFGYLRRDPDALYLDWISVLDANPADSRHMVGGFVNSLEYRNRFAL